MSIWIYHLLYFNLNGIKRFYTFKNLTAESLQIPSLQKSTARKLAKKKKLKTENHPQQHRLRLYVKIDSLPS